MLTYVMQVTHESLLEILGKKFRKIYLNTEKYCFKNITEIS